MCEEIDWGKYFKVVEKWSESNEPSKQRMAEYLLKEAERMAKPSILEEMFSEGTAKKTDTIKFKKPSI